MPFFHGRNAQVYITDTGATCRDLSGDFNAVTFAWSRDNPDVTTLGKDTIQRISGLRDATLSGTGIWNSAANAADDTLEALMTASYISVVKYFPGGSLTGCPYYTACMLLSSYEVSGPVNGAVAISWAFQMANGSVTASTA